MSAYLFQNLNLYYWWDCSSHNKVGELGSKRCKSVWSISVTSKNLQISIISPKMIVFFAQYARTSYLLLKLNFTIQFYHSKQISDYSTNNPSPGGQGRASTDFRSTILATYFATYLPSGRAKTTSFTGPFLVRKIRFIFHFSIEKYRNSMENQPPKGWPISVIFHQIKLICPFGAYYAGSPARRRQPSVVRGISGARKITFGDPRPREMGRPGIRRAQRPSLRGRQRSPSEPKASDIIFLRRPKFLLRRPDRPVSLAINAKRGNSTGILNQFREEENSSTLFFN